MAFGSIGRGWPSRIRHAGTYDQDWIDNVFPFLPADFDTRYFQCAPEDQQIGAPEGGEPVVMINLTPDGRREFALPSVEVPVVFFRRRAERVETRGVLDTLLFEPDAERFSMVWRASLKLQCDIFEIPQAVVGRMSRAWWRSIETGKSYQSLDSIVRKKAVPAGAGTMPTDTPLFAGLLVGVILIVGALTFFPALSLGPIVEHLLMLAGKLF